MFPSSKSPGHLIRCGVLTSSALLQEWTREKPAATLVPEASHMFSLIIVSVAIAVAVLLAAASVFYGGDAYEQANEKVKAVSLVQQAQQLLGAAELFQSEHRRWPLSLDELTQNGYLRLQSKSEASISLALAMNTWTTASPGAPVYVYETVETGVCQEVNRLSMSVDAIPTAARTGYSTQCIGKSPDQLLVIASRGHAELRQAADEGGLITPEDVWPASLPYPDQPQYWLVEPPVGKAATPESPALPAPEQIAAPSPSQGAVLKVSDLAMTFRDTATHSWSTRTLVLANSGDQPLTFESAVALATGSPFVLRSNNCPSSLEPGKYCSLEIRFAPTAPGTYNTSMVIQHPGLLSIPISGRAFNPLSLGTATLPSGTVDVAYQPFDFRPLLNVSTAVALDMSKVSWAVTAGSLPAGMKLDAASGVLGGTPGQTTAAAGTTFTVTASYQGNTTSQTLNIIIKAAVMDNVIPQGQEPAPVPEPLAPLPAPSPGLLVLSEGTIAFGSAATNTTTNRSLTLGNAGGSPLSLASGAALQGSSAFALSQNSCQSVLLPGMSCTVEIAFSPKSTGTFSATLLVNADQQHSVTLTATAFNPVSLQVASLPTGTRGQPYAPFDLASLLTVSNELQPDKTQARWAIAGGTLPDGMTLNTDTGILSGTPTQTSSGNSITLAVTYKLNKAQRSYKLDVLAPALDVSQIAAGAAHTCAITTSSGLKCWGSTLDGRLGRGPWPALPGENTAASPVQVLGLESGVKQVSAGWVHTCAVTTTGKALCWGGNYSGQLGNGITGNQLSPVGVAGLATGVRFVSAGADHSCALLENGTVRCWGQNDYGELGDGSTTDRATPVQVSSLTNVAKISTGERHSCALTGTGAVWCWGVNTYGQLGDGTQTARNVPVLVSGLGSGVADISTGGYHTCAVLTSGMVRCWGSNQFGQLGDTSTSIRTIPAAVTGLDANMVSIGASQQHTCALTNSGSAYCWGSNSDYRLGRGPTTNAPAAAPVRNLTANVIAISTGLGHTCAVMANQTARCWGDNRLSQLGDGGTSDQSSPVTVVQ